VSNLFARELRKSMTDAERKLWHGLRLRQMHGYKFRRQFTLGAYIVDFVCQEARLVIEVDGGQHADEAYGDAQRDAWLSTQKFRVLRYWNNQVLNELDAVLEDIARELEEHPTPPSRPSVSLRLIPRFARDRIFDASCALRAGPARGEGE